MNHCRKLIVGADTRPRQARAKGVWDPALLERFELYAGIPHPAGKHARYFGLQDTILLGAGNSATGRCLHKPIGHPQCPTCNPFKPRSHLSRSLIDFGLLL